MAIFTLAKCFGKRKHQNICDGYMPSSSSVASVNDNCVESSDGSGEACGHRMVDEKVEKSAHLSPSVTATTTGSITDNTFIDEEEGESSSDCDRKPVALSTTIAPFLMLGSDAMVSVVGFLDPRETLNLLTMPLCKEWRLSYTSDQELWRTICRADPFSADLSNNSASDDNVNAIATPHVVSCYDDIDDDSFCYLWNNGNDVFGEYRLIYTSFVRCMNYLDRVQDIDNGNGGGFWSWEGSDNGSGCDTKVPTFGVTKSLKKFLSRSKEYNLLKSPIVNDTGGVSSEPIGIASDGREIRKPFSKIKLEESGTSKPKYGNSMITSRLWGPTTTGVPSHLNLPKSCAIYSIINWMVAHPNVRGIQIMCIRCLPPLLEDELQRTTGQRVGLVEVILCAMLRFPESSELHIAVFHAIVLLARPIGGREGMLFDNSMAETTQNIGLTSLIELTDSVSLASRCGGLPTLDEKDSSSEAHIITNSNLVDRQSGTTGISILIDSMERFASCEKLQSMACWALVNVALVPIQKNMLMELGGIEAILNAMKNHSKCFDVQFRALFALINMVVPCRPSDFLNDTSIDGEEATRIEGIVLDQLGSKIARLSVSAMKNFCSSETILNRGCLVVHNLSQSPTFMPTLLETPHCYQILEWCATNHSTDRVLRRSVMSTLRRMQVYLDEHPDEQERFSLSLEIQNLDVLEQLW
eukprot:CAMPEP_0168168594 /NCGR_PEP_ID=MMETSP0139_2-20121125/3179_1 /TAXON_ID=44445 /ORGANISM="Pseudo-nitzschia australis, Strain 10249 10 AB" /LENGTH=695 /DNA_ID=CAMNT_0008085939 /DNA_START=84 /DNA_END=2171 /DNA_ORIENTATION=-